MKLVEFLGCCTALICHDFGGTPLASGKKSKVAKAKIKQWLKEQNRHTLGRRCLVIITNNQQTAANSVLLELGFKHSAWMSKTQHPESKIRLWWKEPK